MRKNLRLLISKLLICSGAVKRADKRVKNKQLVTSIYFHNPSAKLFEQCIMWLISKDYYFISVNELYYSINNKISLKKGAVCLTVDDGRRENLTNIVPLVNRLNIPIAFFISTEPVENGVFWWTYLQENNLRYKEKISIDATKNKSNKERIEILNKLKEKIKLPREAVTKEELINLSTMSKVTIGNHTHNHPITTKCDENELEFEIVTGAEKLQSWIDKDVQFFAYPNGNFDKREYPYLHQTNTKLAFTTIPRHIDTSEKIDLFQIPRFSVNDHGSFSENICKMTGVWQNFMKFIFQT